MGATKQMIIEQMEKDGEEYTDEYGGFMDNDETEFEELTNIPSRSNEAEEEEMKKFGSTKREKSNG
jgi:hypothetical protein